jgi:2,3-bisphosphoglycerate-independent phosphoglycerate mutase
MNMKKVALIILDGWGIGDGSKSDAIANANTPYLDNLIKSNPHSTLLTSGEHVGLPVGQMGNSEVGHLNIGAGRIVYQDLAKINKAVKEKTIDTNTELVNTFNYVKENNKDLHLMGLVSEGGVHSSQAHLHYLCDLAKQNDIKNVFIHVFTDGRDTDPKSGLNYIKNLEEHLKTSTGKIATVIGRYYAMDRDKRWERVKLAYDLLTDAKGEKTNDVIAAIKNSYSNDVTDEFIKPIVNTDENGNPLASIKEGDAVICFNFRTDRCREITQVLTQNDMPEEGMKTIPLHFATMTNYNSTYKNIKVLYSKDNLVNTLGEVLETAGKTQLRVAETEKYPHVTFFFSGGREAEFKGESRLMAPSPKVATYDLQPEMSAAELTDIVTKEFNTNKPDFVCLNYANMDMVGHTGDYAAVTKAVETVDACTKRLVEVGLKNDYSFILIADHGNSDFMINADGSPNTAHTTNLVPCVLIDKDFKSIKDGKLGDLAPSILKMMGVNIPTEMDGNILV